jgi:hypothetical protein
VEVARQDGDVLRARMVVCRNAVVSRHPEAD